MTGKETRPPSEDPEHGSQRFGERLEGHLDELASQLRSGYEEAAAPASEPYDDPEYHALATGFHQARQCWLEDSSRGRLLAMRPRPADPRRPAARLRFLVGLAALFLALVGGGILLSGGFGGGESPGATSGAPDTGGSHFRGGSGLELQIDANGPLPRFSWSEAGRPWSPSARVTLRLYLPGALDPVLAKASLAGQTCVLDASDLEQLPADQRIFEAEVQMETGSGEGPWARERFELQN